MLGKKIKAKENKAGDQRKEKTEEIQTQ